MKKHTIDSRLHDCPLERNAKCHRATCARHWFGCVILGAILGSVFGQFINTTGAIFGLGPNYEYTLLTAVIGGYLGRYTCQIIQISFYGREIR